MFEKVVELAKEKGYVIKTMESCTGGAVASEITNVEGASSVLRESFVTYSNESKIAHGVSEEVIEKNSVYSVETAIEMAKACLKTGLHADIGVGITGNFANVDPANKEYSKAGVVYMAVASKSFTIHLADKLDTSKSRRELKEDVCRHIEKMLGVVLNCSEK